MKEKVENVMEIMSSVKFSHPIFEYLSDDAWSKSIGTYHSAIEDLCLVSLFGKKADELDEIFTTPGAKVLESNKIVLWDDGYPPEEIVNLLKSNRLNDKKVVKRIIHLAEMIENGVTQSQEK